MFLKELELVGFKSFPEKTTLKFEPGITAIVGPNGCGKSNIFDSIRWVLGEQSTKALRSIKMEDVVFSGTDGKPPLGMAEVTLIFSNENRKIAIDCDEIEVCRRIFRSGESQYLLNKAPVRLKDILDLFMGTGIGAESYSLVEQGEIDLVLSTRPEERRLIFDEASGITKYKAQKREALRKLEETEQNLLRVNDIISEVRREINSLERQANKARRYKETFEELKEKEVGLAALQIRELDARKRELSEKIEASGKNMDSYEAQIQEIQRGVSARLNMIQQLEKEISYHHDKLINIDNLIINNNHRIKINQERIGELDSRILNLKSQLEEAKSRIETARNNLENFRKEHGDLKEAVRHKEVLLSRKQKEYEELNLSIKSSQDKIRQAKNQILDLASSESKVKNEIADLQALLKSHILRKKRLDIEAAKTKEEKQGLQEQLNQRVAESESTKAELERINAEAAGVRQRRDSAQAAQDRLARDIQGLESGKIALQSQKEFLQELRLKYESIGQPMKAVLYLDNLPREDITGFIVKVEERSLKPERQEAGAPGVLNYRLSGEAKPMPLETGEIEQRIELIQAEIEKKSREKEDVQISIRELEQNLEGLGQKIKAQEMFIGNKSLQIENLEERLNKINQECDVLNLELEDLEAQIEQLNNKQDRLNEQLSRSQEQQKIQGDEISSLEKAIVEHHSLREETLISITQIKTEIENLNARLVQQEKTQNFLESAYQESLQQNLRYLDEVGDAESKTAQLSRESENLKQQNKQAAEDKTMLSQNQDAQKAEYKELSGLQEKDNNKIISLGQKTEEVRKHVYEYQMQVQELDFKDRSIRDRIKQVYKFQLEGPFESSGGQNQEALSAEIAELSRKLDSYGTVNLIAIEEYEELKKRYDFLNQQQNDLIQAKESLSEAISKINRTTRRMFLDTFIKIQEEFRNYFRLLFGGGEADIILIDESSPLESGIEIICRPPGKKLQNVLALSGGEKALSAVALIFAIFKVKPAPFCVLDEIDAALDEANIVRFSGILQEFAKTSQFLVITHNKRTIANADIMYGITMQEPGVSSIVSVKFSAVEAAV
ncbi:MAG: AAA family ATPase [Candidatus Omnitrophota bacterium]